MPAVSVIIPVYNTAPYLRRCLDSVVGQTLREIEIICVNDGSTDDSLAILQEYATADRRVRIINLAKNSGAAAARNAGIDAATGEYIGFVDSDDYVESNFFESLYSCAISNNSGVAKGNICSVLPNGDIGEADITINQNINNDKIFFTDFFTTAIYKKLVITGNNIKFLDGISQGEDRFFLISAILLCNTVSVTNDATYYYIRRNDSSNSLESLSNKNVADGLLACIEIVNFVNSLEPKHISDKSCLYIFYQQIRTIVKFILPRCSYEYSVIRDCAKTVINIYKKCNSKERLFCFLLFDLSNISLLDCIVSYDIDGLACLMNKTLPSSSILPKTNKRCENEKHLQVNDQTHIPKILHYIWPGTDDKNDMVKRNIDNFRSILPKDWVIKEWNPYNFDFDWLCKSHKYFGEINSRKMYAFIVDYVRAVVLYMYGGVYVDTDVEIIKPFSESMLSCQMFLPIQNEKLVEPAIWGSIKGHLFLKSLIEMFQENICKIHEYTLPDILRLMIGRKYEIYRFPVKAEQFIFTTNDGAITFYPEEYFIPFRFGSQFRKECLTSKTTTIHWFSGSWTKNEDNMQFLKTKVRYFFSTTCPEEKKVSIIVPIYNVENYLPKCLDSIISQTYKNIEIICINDGSPDSCSSILDDYASRDYRIKIVNHEKNLGLATARNTGLDSSTGDYIASVDSDDWIDADYIKSMVVAIEGSGADIVMNSNLLVHRGTIIMGRANWCHYNNKIGFNTVGLIEAQKNLNYLFYNPFLYLYKREIIKSLDLRFPDGLIFEDCCFTLMLLPNIKDVYIINSSAYHYLKRDDSIMSSSRERYSDIIKIAELIYLYYKKHKLLDTNKVECAGIIIEKLRFFIHYPGKFDELKVFAEKIAYDVMIRKHLYENYEINFLCDLLQCDSLAVFAESIMPKWEDFMNKLEKPNNVFSLLRNKILFNMSTF